MARPGIPSALSREHRPLTVAGSPIAVDPADPSQFLLARDRAFSDRLGWTVSARPITIRPCFAISRDCPISPVLRINRSPTRCERQGASRRFLDEESVARLAAHILRSSHPPKNRRLALAAHILRRFLARLRFALSVNSALPGLHQFRLVASLGRPMVGIPRDRMGILEEFPPLGKFLGPLRQTFRFPARCVH